jgi:hypothetical protein
LSTAAVREETSVVPANGISWKKIEKVKKERIK